MDEMANQLRRIDGELGQIGAAQSRLETSFNAVSAKRENLVGSESLIRSADVAHEAGELVRSRVLQSAAQALLAQATQGPELALTLLRF